MPPETNTSSRSIPVHPIGIETVWAQCIERMDKHLVAAVGPPGISSPRSRDVPGGGCMTLPNAHSILAAVLDQLLAGVDARTVLLPGSRHRTGRIARLAVRTGNAFRLRLRCPA